MSSVYPTVCYVQGQVPEFQEAIMTVENAQENLLRLVDGLREQALAAERERTLLRTEVGQLKAANVRLREKKCSQIWGNEMGV